MQALRGPLKRRCPREKNKSEGETGLSATARAACTAFSEAALFLPPAPRDSNKKPRPHIWGRAVIMRTHEAATQAAAAFEAS